MNREVLVDVARSCANLQPYACLNLAAFGILSRPVVDAILCDVMLIAHQAKRICACAMSEAERLELERLATLHGDGGPVVSLRSLWCFVATQVPKIQERIEAALSEENSPC